MSDVVRDLLKNCIDERARLRAELDAERERVARKDERIEDALEWLAEEQAKTAKLRAALAETLAVATRNEEGDFADRARAVLEETDNGV